MMKTNNYITFLSAMAIFFSCSEKQDDFQPIANDDTVKTELLSTTESIVSTEAQSDDVTETLEYEEEQFSEYDEILSLESSVDGLKSALLDVDPSKSEALSNALREWRLRYVAKKCPNVGIENGEDEGFPKTIVLDYGEETILENEKVLSGTIQIEISAPKSEAGATVEVSYQNMTIDSVTVNGSCTKTFYREEGYYTVEREITLSYPDELTITRTATLEKRWVSGLDTPRFPSDDAKQTTGSFTSVDSDGNNYSRVISSPLVKEGTCRFIASGVIDFYSSDVLFASLNYGDGTCDREATYTNYEEETEKEITIGVRKRVLRKKEK